jgi:hypothetical protein
LSYLSYRGDLTAIVSLFYSVGRNNAARILVALGAMVLIASALRHLSDYPKDLAAVSASNLDAPLKGGCALFISWSGWTGS